MNTNHYCVTYFKIQSTASKRDHCNTTVLMVAYRAAVERHANITGPAVTAYLNKNVEIAFTPLNNFDYVKIVICYDEERRERCSSVKIKQNET